MEAPSSHDLFPAHGARFVFTRQAAATDVEYDVEVYRSGGVVERMRLSWSPDLVLQPMPADMAVIAAVTKLARPLRRAPKSRLIRWREL